MVYLNLETLFSIGKARNPPAHSEDYEGWSCLVRSVGERNNLSWKSHIPDPLNFIKLIFLKIIFQNTNPKFYIKILSYPNILYKNPNIGEREGGMTKQTLTLEHTKLLYINSYIQWGGIQDYQFPQCVTMSYFDSPPLVLIKNDLLKKFMSKMFYIIRFIKTKT